MGAGAIELAYSTLTCSFSRTLWVQTKSKVASALQGDVSHYVEALTEFGQKKRVKIGAHNRMQEVR